MCRRPSPIMFGFKRDAWGERSAGGDAWEDRGWRYFWGIMMRPISRRLGTRHKPTRRQSNVDCTCRGSLLRGPVGFGLSRWKPVSQLGRDEVKTLPTPRKANANVFKWNERSPSEATSAHRITTGKRRREEGLRATVLQESSKRPVRQVCRKCMLKYELEG
jgi:hypothetical protein